MQLSLQNFSTLVQNMSASIQSAASQLLDLTVGSTLRAIIEANASVALWMQWLILQVLQTTRAATSNGTDLDSWMSDFSLTRFPAAPARGIVTFSRYTPLATALLPLGALVRTADGTQTYAVTADPANTAFSSAQNGYVLSAGVASIDVPVLAQVAGASGNVQPSAVSLIVTAIPGVDTVNNSAPFLNGAPAETDDALRSRFRNFISSRSRGTPLAVGYAISSIQQGLVYTIEENVDAAGNFMMGSFVVTVDDGSGSPSPSLLATVSTAIDAVRPVGSIFMVRPPAIVTVTVSLSISVASSVAKASVIGPVSAAITDFIDALAIGTTLPLTRIAQIAYDAHPAVVNVANLNINGDNADIVPPVSAVVKAGLVSVT